ncbi:MAG TPA: biopolymer transporter ExbD [Herbaspirillum sp.]|jgi:biopolymer transport protein ExbD
MAMNVGSSSGSGNDEPMLEMNMTPLIDVMLVLIIMLIITIPIQNHAVNLDMPVPSLNTKSVPPVVDTIDVAEDGTLLWNGDIVAGRAALERKLSAVAAAATVAQQDEVHLRPNRNVAYKSVAAVLASAQRLGVAKIGIVGNEEFLQD